MYRKEQEGQAGGAGAGLNARQRAFVRGVLVGKSATQAYKDAGYQAKGHSAESAAQRLLSHVEVQGYLHELEGEARQGAIMDKRRALERLSAIGEHGKDADSIRAIEALGKLAGYYEPERSEAGITVRIGSSAPA